MKRVALGFGFLLVAVAALAATWVADNSNGTFTNPLFYDEFSDPDLIRVGDDYYLTGTTMHAMPGLPVLHSRDLVNWRLLGYACDRLDLGPEYRLEDGKEAYGQGIWAPCLRYDGDTWHIFANVNKHGTLHFTARDPAGPWTRTLMKRSFHDLSVLFEDGKAYVVWGYQDLQFAQLNADLTDIVPGTQRTLFEKSARMGEGAHFYKFDGRYFIISAWWDGRMRMVAARADRLDGPWEVNRDISVDEDFGLAEGNRLWKIDGPPFAIQPGSPASRGRMSLHQGGIVSTVAGEWWGFSMMDANSVGRLTCLSPVTWHDGWPYFGLPGNLGRTPRTWTKPRTAHTSPPSAPYQRSDDFVGPRLANVWQWNHAPDDTRWSLSERPGFLRLHVLPAPDFWRARNTLTQRAVGPVSVATAQLDASGLKPGDVAGLALLNRPYAWLGVRRTVDGLALEQFDQATGQTHRAPLVGERVWLRASCNFRREVATFSYSVDGREFRPLGGEFTLVFQLKTFQGVRFGLFAFNATETSGGHADFDDFALDEPEPRGLSRAIPVGRAIRLSAHGIDAGLRVKDGLPVALPLREGRASTQGEPPPARGSSGTSLRDATEFLVHDLGAGRVALRTRDGRSLAIEDGRVVLTATASGDAAAFQWIESWNNDLILLSLATHRYLRLDPQTGQVTADAPGPAPSRRDGVCLDWQFSSP
jgi:xylan 1,4-beta-xylosidase